MKTSTTPVKAKRSVRAATRPSAQRQTAERVYRLTRELGSRLQALEKLPPVKVEFATAPGAHAPGIASPALSPRAATLYVK